MKERPILFSGPMVRAILERRKTMTRRVMDIDHKHFVECQGFRIVEENIFQTAGNLRNHGVMASGLYAEMLGDAYYDLKVELIRCPFGQPGDRLWVRETWGDITADHPLCKDGRKPTSGDRIVYRANPADDYQWGIDKSGQGDFCWRPSIHMPRWASRILLEITAVRVERVQDISSRDAWNEGAICSCTSPVPWCAGNIETFHAFWDSINAKRGYGWDANPWVWVIEFKHLKGVPR